MIESKVLDICNKGNLTYIKIPSFEKTNKVNHCFSTRLGGVSEGIYSSLNLGFNREDSEENVRKNFQLLCEAININPNNLVFSDQIHEDKIIIVDELDRGKGYNRDSDILGVDGIITNKRNVALTTFYADCVPLYFLDPVKEVIALSHAGWRGTVKKIGYKTIVEMIENFSCDPKDILVCIGPSIGNCCFEVSEDVKIKFEKILNHDIIEKIIGRPVENKWYIDLWTANEEIIMMAGVPKENITKTDICTMCNKEVLFSHRGLDGKRGSLAAIMELK
jgi:YfiH family protein